MHHQKQFVSKVGSATYLGSVDSLPTQGTELRQAQNDDDDDTYIYIGTYSKLGHGQMGKWVAATMT